MLRIFGGSSGSPCGGKGPLARTVFFLLSRRRDPIGDLKHPEEQFPKNPGPGGTHPHATRNDPE